MDLIYKIISFICNHKFHDYDFDNPNMVYYTARGTDQFYWYEIKCKKCGKQLPNANWKEKDVPYKYRIGCK